MFIQIAIGSALMIVSILIAGIGFWAMEGFLVRNCQLNAIRSN